MRTILLNNKFVTEEQAKVSIFSPILRGFGVFETLRTFKNKNLFRPEEHISRLQNSADQIELELQYTPDQILQQLKQVIQKSSYNTQRIKILATPDTLIIFSEELEPQPTKPVDTISLVQTRSLPTIKSISYLDSYLANQKAKKQGATEAILTDEQGTVYEGAYSNIFWIKDNTLYTRNDHILPGITRKAVLEISHLPTKFTHIHINDLKKADEVFLTSSIKGITSIKKIDNTPILKTEQTEELQKALNQLQSKP